MSGFREEKGCQNSVPFVFVRMEIVLKGGELSF